MEYGIVGAAMSLNLTYIMNSVILDVLIATSADFAHTMVSHDQRSFSGWEDYFSIGLYGALLECLGWWNLNICFMFSGYFGVRQIAV